MDYYAFGMPIPGRNYNNEKYRYVFNGMEKDDELKGTGNHLSWGDYGYDPRTIRRWQPDPMQAKYPWHSPYIAMANNQIVNKEIDGKDFAMYIDHNTKTILVVATIYTNKSDIDATQAAVNAAMFWNNQSGKFQYVVAENDAEKTYEIIFSVIVEMVEYPHAEKIKDRDNKNNGHSGADNSSNVLFAIEDENYAETKNETTNTTTTTVGGVIGGYIMKIPRILSKEKTLASHEAGHYFGASDISRRKGAGIMYYLYGNLEKFVSITSMKDIIISTLTGNNSENKTLEQNGEAPSNFSHGQI